jgi:hypothetical protein
MNATYEVGGQGSEHVHNHQRQRLIIQLPILRFETRSHDMAKSISLVEIDSRSIRDLQELLCKTSCGN